MKLWPSLTGPLFPKVAVGATLLTLTARDLVSEPPSPSETVTLGLCELSPSSHLQSKLPAPVAALKLALDSVPPSQLCASRLKVSLPGSDVV